VGRFKSKRRPTDEGWGFFRLLFSPIIGAVYLLMIAIRLVSWLVVQIFSWMQTEAYFLKVKLVVGQFHNALALRKSQLVVIDQYGINTADWEREKTVFVKRFLLPCPPEVTVQRVSRLIDKQLREQFNKKTALPIIESAIDYEIYCANQLAKAGWKTCRTAPSGDQGIDIFATKDGLSAVFQCKWYSHPVGNKAVQEVLAGKLFQEADFAVVLTNAQFTPSARHLANRTGVHLLHHSQIEEFTTQLSIETQTTSG
jgi:restriction system protein